MFPCTAAVTRMLAGGPAVIEMFTHTAAAVEKLVGYYKAIEVFPNTTAALATTESIAARTLDVSGELVH
jgi:hypothetical protein